MLAVSVLAKTILSEFTHLFRGEFKTHRHRLSIVDRSLDNVSSFVSSNCSNYLVLLHLDVEVLLIRVIRILTLIVRNLLLFVRVLRPN